jgi:hypothetical protein
MNNDFFFCMGFDSTTHSIQTEKLAKQKFKTCIIPTPREVTNDCGLAIKFLSGEIEEILKFFEGLKVPCALYKINNKRINGVRECKEMARR